MALGKGIEGSLRNGSRLDEATVSMLRNLKPGETRAFAWLPDEKVAGQIAPFIARIERADRFHKAYQDGYVTLADGTRKPFMRANPGTKEAKANEAKIANILKDKQEAIEGPVGSVAKDDSLIKVVSTAINAERTRLQQACDRLARNLKGVSFKVQQGGSGFTIEAGKVSFARSMEFTCVRVAPIADVALMEYADLSDEERDALGIVLPEMETEPEATEAEKAMQAVINAEEASKSN